MSSTEARSNHASSDAAAGTVDMHLEVQIIPVSGVDRSKQFYQRLGSRLDADVAPLDGLRIVQFTPPGLGRLGHVRHRAYHGRARLGRGRADRRRHRRGRRRPGRPRHRRERDLARPAVPSRGPAARPRPRAPATGPSSPSPTRTATLGWSRRSPRGCPAAPTPRAPPLRPQRTWPARCGGPRWPTARMRSARGGRTCFHRPGHDGDWPGRYAASWWPNGPGRTCQRDRFWPRPRASRVQHRGNVATVDTSSVSGG
jgi:hypothetical protein